MNKYIFKPYDKAFPDLFNKEKLKLIKIFPNLQIEHVGSSAVPGLGGKGIIDIAIKTSKNKSNRLIKKLHELGYECTPEHPANDNSIFLQKIIRRKGKERRIHVHLTLNNKFWNSFIVARDYLIDNKRARDEYSKLKQKAVMYARGDADKYRNYKNDFLKELVRKALKVVFSA